MSFPHRLLAFTFLLNFGSSSFAQTHYVSTRGKEIINPDGSPLLIRGTNLGNWLVPEGYMFKFKNASSPRLIDQTLRELIGPDQVKLFWKKFTSSYITSDDIHFLKSVGMNSIRVPFNYRMFTDPNYLGGMGESGSFALLDRLIGWCKKEKLFVLLDMHCAPGGQTGDNIDDSYGFPFLFDNAQSQELTVNLWRKIAAHYSNEPTVLGYDLLNEPIAHFFDTAHFNPLLEPLYRKIIKAIRLVDQHHLVFLGGAQWDSNFNIFGPPFDSKAVYTFHKYWTATTQDVIQPYLDFRNRYNVPIYCGETGENADDWILNFRKRLEENNIGWHFWPYKKMNDNGGIISFELPGGYEYLRSYADSAKLNLEDVRKFRPADRALVLAALEGMLVNCRFANCRPNWSYIHALGLGSAAK